MRAPAAEPEDDFELSADERTAAAAGRGGRRRDARVVRVSGNLDLDLDEGDVGRIRINTRTGCQCVGSFSPQPTFGTLTLQ